MDSKRVFIHGTGFSNKPECSNYGNDSAADASVCRALCEIRNDLNKREK